VWSSSSHIYRVSSKVSALNPNRVASHCITLCLELSNNYKLEDCIFYCEHRHFLWYIDIKFI
jgi:hypothetical protein